MQKFGIDISKWNGNFDIAATGAEFVIIKAGGSDGGTFYIDSKFRRNYSECKRLNVPAGVYWYTAAKNVQQLKLEIDYLLANLEGLKFELPIYLDLEESVCYNVANDLAVYWLTTLYNKGWYPGIYSAYSWFYSVLEDPLINTFPIWLAYWTTGSFKFKWTYGIWQFGTKDSAAGKVDVNYMYTDYTATIKEQGLNGYQKKETQRFKDVKPGLKGYNAINYCAENGFMKGFSDGTFRPDQNVTREQLAIVIERITKND